MKILLGTDGSRYARYASRFLRSSLDEEQSIRIDVLALLPSAGSVYPAHVNTETAERWADEAAAIFSDLPGEVHTLVTQGDPGQLLVERSVEYDLVVVGVKGRGAAPFFELGSTALAVIRHSAAPVLLVRPPGRSAGKSSGEGTAERPLQLLLTSDVGDSTLGTASGLLDRFARRDAEIELISVLEAGNPRERTSGWLETAAREIGATYASPKSRLLEGEPAREIARRATEEAADLIVLGTRCPDAGPGTPLGRTARELAWSAPCSVLLVRGHGTELSGVMGDGGARSRL